MTGNRSSHNMPCWLDCCSWRLRVSMKRCALLQSSSTARSSWWVWTSASTSRSNATSERLDSISISLLTWRSRVRTSCQCHITISEITTPFNTMISHHTIDHNILITRLSSWFGIQGSVLSWFESYLTSRSFRVKCDKDFSSEHVSSCGVPQGSVLNPLLFVM